MHTQTFTRLQQISLSFRQGVAASDLAAMAQLPLLKELCVRSERGCSTSFLPSLAALTGLTQLSLSLYCCERDPVEVSAAGYGCQHASFSHSIRCKLKYAVLCTVYPGFMKLHNHKIHQACGSAPCICGLVTCLLFCAIPPLEGQHLL